MKIKLLIIVFSIATISYSQLTEKENRALDELIFATELNIEVNEITGSAINEVFSTKFFDVKRISLDESWSPFYFMKRKNTEGDYYNYGGYIESLQNELVPHINPSFRIRDEKDVEKLKRALRLISSTFNDGYLGEISQKDAQWFIQCVSNNGNESSGILISTNNNKEIIDIDFTNCSL